MSTTQLTLDGGETKQERERPSTWLYCDECDAPVLRSRRWDHAHELSGATAYTQAQYAMLNEEIPEHAKLNTATYEVTFHYEMVETVRVGAVSKAEAKTEAEHHQTYDGEITHTLHTDCRAVSEKSQATIEYLETHGLLPEDHDVTREDIIDLINYQTNST